MSLQGSLETFALPDVLVLLSSTKKDGELRVVGGRVDGKLWLEKGQIVHTVVSGKERSPVDAVFELLRLDAGTFNFEVGSDVPHRGEPATIDLVLADAQVRLAEWNEIAKVVPHLDAVVDMAAEAPAAEVTVTSGQWRLLRAVAGGCTVSALMAKTGDGEFDACRKVKDLVEASLATLDVSASRPRPAQPAATAEPAVASESRAPAEPLAPDGQDVAAPSGRTGAVSAGGTGALSAGNHEASKESAPANASADGDRKRAAKQEAAGAPSPLDDEDELQRLAELAARESQPKASKVRAHSSQADQPAKIRASAPSPASDDAAGPAAVDGEDLERLRSGDEPAEDAKALVAQLAAIDGTDEQELAEKVAQHVAEGGELPPVAEGDEPINRGLLLKFLSSVRN